MKNNLLVTTALIAVITAGNAWSGERTINQDIVNQTNTELNESGALLINYGDKVTISDNINITGNNSTVGAAGGIKALDGFTTGNGLNVSGNKSESKMGGGIYIRLVDDSGYDTNHVTATNREVVIGNNANISNNYSKWLGGGIALESAEKVTIGDGALFNANHSDAQGGAIAVWSDSDNKLNGGAFENKTLLQLGQASFTNNEALGNGGAIANMDQNTVIIGSNSVFSGNTAQANGGAVYNEGTVIIGDNVSFADNSAINNSHNSDTEQGGAIYSKGDDAKVSIGNNAIFSNNKAYAGAGVYLAQGSDMIIGDNVKFINNTSLCEGADCLTQTPKPSAGAIAIAIGTKASGSTGNEVTDLKIGDNAVFSGNKGEFAGAIKASITRSAGANENSVKVNIGKNALFENNVAEGNYSLQAGAIYNQGTFEIGEGAVFRNNKVIETAGNTSGGTGGAIVNQSGAVMTLNGALFEGNQSVSAGGAIRNKGTLNLKGNNIFTGNVLKDGSLNDISNTGTINVAGNLTLDGGISENGILNLAKGTNLNVKADTTTISNQVQNSGANLGLTFANGYGGGTYELITNGGSLNNEFNIHENGIWNINTTNTKGTYEITKKTTGEIASATGANLNQAGTVNAITSGNSGNVVFDNIAGKVNNLLQSSNPSEVQTGLDAATALAPETNAAVQSASTETTNQIFGAVGTRLSGGSVASGGEGMSSGDNYFKRGAMWVQGLFNKAKLDDTSKAKGFDANSRGIAFGAEKLVTDDVKAGIGYAFTHTDIDSYLRDTDVDTHTAIVYGEYKPTNWYVNGIATYSWSDYEEQKYVAGFGLKADYDVDTIGLQAMTGYDLQINGFGLTPEAGLRYVHIKQDGYRDGAGQGVSANDSDILTGVIGAKVNKYFSLANGTSLKPEARLAFTYDLVNDDTNSVVTLANGSAYNVNGEALNRFGVEIGGGVTAEVNDTIELSLGYEGKFREDYQDHTGLINAKYKF